MLLASLNLDATYYQLVWTERYACGRYPTSHYTFNIPVTQASIQNYVFSDLFKLILVIEPCLDVEWLAEDIFASCGADEKIQIIRLGTPTPLKTLL